MIKIQPEPLFFSLSLRYNPTKKGVIKGTKNLPNIEALNYRNFSPRNLEYDFYIKKTEELLTHNISKIQTKKIAIGLSGGTDSSLNALILSKNENIRLKLFCIGFGDENDEFEDARIIAKICNTDYKEIIITDIIKDLPKRIWEFGAPKSNLWPYYNFKLVQKLGAKATLSGEGGDELFGGYFFRYKKYLEKIPNTSFERAKRYVFGRPRDWIPNFEKMFGKKFKQNNFEVNSRKIIEFFEPSFNNNLPFLSQIFLADYNNKLRFDFEFVDSVFGKKEKIKIFSPFLQKNIINFATHIPNQFKISKHTSKMILRDILKKMGAPKRIYEKPKQGWGMNPSTIWKQGLDDKCERFLFNAKVVEDGWIEKKWVLETYKLIEKNINVNPEKTFPYINKIWDVLAFEIFYLQRILKQTNHGKISDW